MSSTGASTPIFRVLIDDEAFRAVVNATITELMAKGLIGIATPTAPADAEPQQSPQRKIRCKPNAPLVDDAIYVAREAAPYLGVTHRTLQRLHAEGNGPPRIALSRHRFGYKGSDLSV
jgi:hypothetical protein